MSIPTVLLITTDRSGTYMAMIQSSRRPFPRIVIVHSPGALEEVWNRQSRKEIFFHSICSFGEDQALIDKKKELGIKDGEYEEI